MATQVYLFTDLDKVDDTWLVGVEPLLSQQRLEKIGRYRFRKDKVLSTMTYLVFLYAYYRQTGTKLVRPTFEIGPQGKPLIKENIGLSFNLSHCDLACCCGLSTGEIGVDVQDIHQTKDFDWENIRAFSPQELTQIGSCPDPEREALRLWTYKESYLKYLGTGIDKSLHKVVFEQEKNHPTSRWRLAQGPNPGQEIHFSSRDFPGFIATSCSCSCSSSPNSSHTTGFNPVPFITLADFLENYER